MKNKPILIVAGQPKSVFFEIFFKSLKLKKYKCPLILIASLKVLKSEIKKFNFNKNIRLVELDVLKKYKIDNKKINLVNIDKFKNSNSYIKKCFDVSFKILKSGYTDKLINGPIDKSKFLNKKYLGITEYISKKTRSDNTAMLIYNNELSVCPLTTHLPIRLVPKKISQKLIFEKTNLINKFFINHVGFKPKIAVTGLNPHCESILKLNEDKKIIYPAIKKLKKKGFKIFGPFSGDTIFLKQNREKYNVVLGMYHDQVLGPLKAIKEYNAINITLGLPFLRISPDHGPNEKMINQNSSSPLSLIKAIQFLDIR